MDCRADHLQWCKDRALAYLEPGPHFSIGDALVSFQSDMRKHPDTETHSGLRRGFQLQMAGHLTTVAEAKQWIEGFKTVEFVEGVCICVAVPSRGVG